MTLYDPALPTYLSMCVLKLCRFGDVIICCVVLLQSVLEDISIHINIDSLEGGMDALAQILTCPEVSISCFLIIIIIVSLLLDTK